MMTEEQAIELGKRAIAAGFRLMPGVMVHHSRDRVVEVRPTRLKFAHWIGYWQFLPRPNLPGNPYYAPDFRDAATLGLLRQQVVNLVPDTVDIWLVPMELNRCHVVWQNRQGKTLKEATYVAFDDWHITVLIAALEAHKCMSY
jgi:hypothetical protein